MAMLFDHEEIGSNSCAGAGSSLFMDTLKLIHQYTSQGAPDNAAHGECCSPIRLVINMKYCIV